MQQDHQEIEMNSPLEGRNDAESQLQAVVAQEVKPD